MFRPPTACRRHQSQTGINKGLNENSSYFNIFFRLVSFKLGVCKS